MVGRSTMIDWDLAVAAASKMSGAGPAITREEAEDVVAELREGAERSTPLVRDFTDLAAGSRTAPVLIVDRAGWIRANADGFAEVIAPLVDKLQSRKGAPSPMAEAVGSRVTGLEVGALLGFMSSKVLGQFDPFYGLDSAGETGPAGRLLLVAPNIVHAEREMGVDPHDFRLWVCLHEETHRTQFTAVPWLQDHLEGEIQSFLQETDVDPMTVLERVREAAQTLAGGRPEAEEDDGGRSLVEIVQTPAQREILGRLTAVMSLLEGHADFVMDGVGPSVVPSVGEIREKFQQRRAKGASRLDLALRKLLGLDAKLRQYRDGERFVRAVVNDVGMDGFNRVWTSPNTLPTKSEIAKPADWVARVHRRAE